MKSGDAVDYAIIRRDEDGAFLAWGTMDIYFDNDIQNAIMYDNETLVFRTIEDITERWGKSCSVWYVTIEMKKSRG